MINIPEEPVWPMCIAIAYSLLILIVLLVTGHKYPKDNTKKKDK